MMYSPKKENFTFSIVSLYFFIEPCIASSFCCKDVLDCWPIPRVTPSAWAREGWHGYSNFGRKLMWRPGVFRICPCRYTNSLCLWSCLWEPFYSLRQVPAKRLFKCTQDCSRFISWVNGFLLDGWGVKSGTNVLSQAGILLWNIVMFRNTGGSCAVALLFVSFL